MITKERLQELIEQRATIYHIRQEIFIAGYSNTYEIISYKLSEPDYYVVDDNCLCLMETGNSFIDEDCCLYAWKLNELFETKEEAEWEIEFGNITRTETLRLPIWEEFKNFINQDITFYRNEYTYILESRIYVDGKETIEINYSYYDYGDNLLQLPFNKENYIEACKLCKKLFLGEEI